MSTITFRARFDGQALVPSEDVPLVKDREYVLVTSENGSAPQRGFAKIRAMARDLGPEDFAERFGECVGRKPSDD